MASGIIYEDVTDGTELEAGSLFEGKQFWIAQRVPGRKELENVIAANGGSVVKLEKQADYMIADHFRKDCPPGSISYTFVRESVAKGELQDPDKHPAGPRVGTAREVGSSSRPAKSTRTPYTPEEDRILYKWAKAAEQSGIPVGGNELYKQLEAQYPRHTFQSWRDRYLRKLQYMPASAFNMSDNEPLSPIRAVKDLASGANKPSAAKGTGLVKKKDRATAAAVKTEPASPGSSASKEHTTSQPAVRSTGLVKNKDKARTAATSEKPESTHTSNNRKQTNAGSIFSKKQNVGEGEFTLKQLEATFSAEDWESVYAFVEDIENCSKEDGQYAKAWANWAENQANQTAEQWWQYYEKVVRPQWLKDPESKRERIRQKVQERLEDAGPDQEQSQNWSQTQEQAELASQTKTAPSTKASKHVAANVLPSDSGLASESTAQQESPKFVKDEYESALKRIRVEVDGAAESKETSRPAKIARNLSRSPTPVQPDDSMDVVGTQEKPLEISSVTSSHSPEPIPEADEEDEAESEVSEDEIELNAPIPQPDIPVEDDEDLESNASSTDMVHTRPLPRPARVPEIEDEDDEEEKEEDDNELDDDEDDSDASLPSNDPTPRATKYNAFDTQAILSPSQNKPHISALPRPPLDSSPPHHPDSDASATQSLQEFSSYLQDDPNLSHDPPLPPPPARPASPTPSTTSTTTESDLASDIDPDLPLTHEEIDIFFAECNEAGFENDAIRKALRRTRGRPVLAEEVLEAWREGEPLPVRRGIWSVEDDDLLERGDGSALEMLAGRHTLDGWGGVTERMNYLRAWRKGG